MLNSVSINLGWQRDITHLQKKGKAFPFTLVTWLRQYFANFKWKKGIIAKVYHLLHDRSVHVELNAEVLWCTQRILGENVARDCPRGKPVKQPFQGELCGWGQPLTGFWLGEAGGRPEPEKREKTEREIKTTLDNEKLQTESIGSKLSIYCELQSSMGRRLFFRRPSHTCLLSRATSCVTSNDSSKWRACSQAKTWLTSPRGSPF